MMIRCIRDNKGRFTKHEWDIPYFDGIAISNREMRKVVRNCGRCGQTQEIQGYRYLVSITPEENKWLIPVDVMDEKNEILTGAEWIEAA